MNLRNFMCRTPITLRVLFVSFSSDGKQLEASKRVRDAMFVGWDDLSLRDGELFAGDIRAASFDRFVVGTVGSNVQMASCLEECAAANGIRVFWYGSPTIKNNKLLQTMKMRRASVPQIKTIIASAGETSSAELSRELGLPVVSKIIDGSQGKGIEKHDTRSSLDRFLRAKNPGDLFIFQKFVPNDGDVRMFYVRDRLVYTITRKSQDEFEFRNNVSLGGKAEFVDPTPEMERIGSLAVASMGFDVTGVDLVQHRVTGEWYVMEINAAPQFWGVETEPVVSAILDFVR